VSAKRAAWESRLLMVIDDFQHIDAESQKDSEIRSVLAALLIVMMPGNKLPDAAVFADLPRRCEKYPDCECEIWEVCAPKRPGEGEFWRHLEPK